METLKLKEIEQMSVLPRLPPISTFLRSIMSASSLPLPVILPIFKAPTLMTVRLPFHNFRCFFTRLPPLFLLLLH